MFITFEGPEGGGKSTQIPLLASWLVEQGCDVLTTREPGGTRIGTAIRDVLLNPEHVEMRAEAEILLFSAARAQSVAEVVRPHLERGGVVLSDRFADSTFAYQGYGRGLDLESLRMITKFATGGLTPDLTICLDVPVAEGLGRKVGGAEWNRMEREAQNFHERVRAGYLAMASAAGERWLVVDARQPAEEVQIIIQARVRQLLTVKHTR